MQCIEQVKLISSSWQVFIGLVGKERVLISRSTTQMDAPLLYRDNFICNTYILTSKIVCKVSKNFTVLNLRKMKKDIMFSKLLLLNLQSVCCKELPWGGW